MTDPTPTRPPRAPRGAAAPRRIRSRPGPHPTPEAVADDARVAELTAEVAERTADLQRLSAEYANYRRRVDRDREAVLVNARAQFVGELLTVLDDIERAGAHGDLTGPFKSVADKLVSVVQKLGPRALRHRGRAVRPVGARGRAAREGGRDRADGDGAVRGACAAATASATASCGPRWSAWSTATDDGTATETPPEGIPVVDPDAPTD